MTFEKRQLIFSEFKPGKVFTVKELLALWIKKTGNGKVSFYNFLSECKALDLIKELPEKKVKLLRVEHEVKKTR